MKDTPAGTEGGTVAVAKDNALFMVSLIKRHQP
jgi:hypothetical protein